MPTFQINIDKEDLIVELSLIYDKLLISYSLSRVARKCLILWAGKYMKKPEKIKIVMEKLKMSAIHMKPFEEQLRDAIIDGELTRAENRGKEIGKEIGIEKGEENIIKRMLKKYNVEEVSKMTEIDIKQIKEIKMKL